MPAVITNFVFTSLAFVAVCIRLGTRTFLLKNVGLDDGLVALSMLASMAFLAVVMLQIKAGLGRMISFPELPAFFHALWATIPIYNLSLILCKLSITVQCYRVLRTPKMRQFFRIYFVILVLYGLWTLFGSIFTCWPVEYYWTFLVPGSEGSCMSKGGVTYSNAALNILTDLVLIVIPAPLLWGLQIPKRQRIILMCLFGVGTFATVISVVRLHALYVIDTSPPAEQSIQGVSIAIWSGIEINTAIICASVPAMRPLVVKIFPKLLLSSFYGRNTGTAKSQGYYVDGSTAQSAAHSRVGGSRKVGGSVSVSAASPTESDLEYGKEGTTEGRYGHAHVHAHVRADGRGHRAGKHSEGRIQVHHEFELRSVPATAARQEREEREREKSRDGSERNLVVASWQDDGRFTFFRDGSERKKGTITRHPHEMV